MGACGGPSAGLSWAWLGLHLVCSFPWPVVTSQSVPLPDAEMRGPLRPESPWHISGPPSRPSALPALACVCLSESMHPSSVGGVLSEHVGGSVVRNAEGSDPENWQGCDHTPLSCPLEPPTPTPQPRQLLLASGASIPPLEL